VHSSIEFASNLTDQPSQGELNSALAIANPLFPCRQPGHPRATCTGGAEQREVREGPVQGTLLEERHGFLQPATPHVTPTAGH